MSFEFRVAASPMNPDALAEDVARSLEEGGFATVNRVGASLAVSIAALGEASWREHASIVVGQTEVMAIVHAGPASIREHLLKRVRLALEKHGTTADFDEL